MPAPNRWNLSDGVDDYDFTINPNKMSSPIPPQVTSSDPSTGIDGGSAASLRKQRIPIEFTASGVLRTEEQYEAFREWVYQKDGRLTLTDHLAREYTVRLIQFIPNERRPSVQSTWRFEFQLRMKVYP